MSDTVDAGQAVLLRVKLYDQRQSWGKKTRAVELPNGDQIWIEVEALEKAIVDPEAMDVELDNELLSLASDPRVVGLPPGSIALVLRLLWPLIERLLSRIDRKRKELSQ